MPSARPQTNIRMDEDIKAKARELMEARGRISLSVLVRQLLLEAHRREIGGGEKKSRKIPLAH